MPKIERYDNDNDKRQNKTKCGQIQKLRHPKTLEEKIDFCSDLEMGRKIKRNHFTIANWVG